MGANGDGPDAGDRRQDLVAPGEPGIGFDPGAQFPVDLRDLGVDLAKARAQLRQDDLVARHADPVSAGRPILDQSNPSDMQLLDFVQFVSFDRGRLEAEHGTHPCKHLRIDAVGLRSLSGSLREASRPCGVHLDVEPPRVYRRVSGSMITRLFRRYSRQRRKPPLLRSV